MDDDDYSDNEQLRTYEVPLRRFKRRVARVITNKEPPFIEFELFINTILNEANAVEFYNVPEESPLHDSYHNFLSYRLPKNRVYVLAQVYDEQDDTENLILFFPLTNGYCTQLLMEDYDESGVFETPLHHSGYYRTNDYLVVFMNVELRETIGAVNFFQFKPQSKADVFCATTKTHMKEDDYGILSALVRCDNSFFSEHFQDETEELPMSPTVDESFRIIEANISENASTISGKVDGSSSRMRRSEEQSKTMSSGLFRTVAKCIFERNAVTWIVAEEFLSYRKSDYKPIQFPQDVRRLEAFLKDKANADAYIPPGYMHNRRAADAIRLASNPIQRFHYNSWVQDNSQIISIFDLQETLSMLLKQTDRKYKSVNTMLINHEASVKEWVREQGDKLVGKPDDYIVVEEGLCEGSLYDIKFSKDYMALDDFLKIIKQTLDSRSSQNLTKFIFKVHGYVRNMADGSERPRSVDIGELTVDYVKQKILYKDPRDNKLTRRDTTIREFKRFYALYSSFFDINEASLQIRTILEMDRDNVYSSGYRGHADFDVLRVTDIRITVINSHHFVGAQPQEEEFVKNIASELGKDVKIIFSDIPDATSKHHRKNTKRAKLENGLSFIYELGINEGNCIASALRQSEVFVEAFLQKFDYRVSYPTVVMINSRMREFKEKNTFTRSTITSFVDHISDCSLTVCIYGVQNGELVEIDKNCEGVIYDIKLFIKNNHVIFIEELPTNFNQTEEDDENFDSEKNKYDVQCYFDLETINIGVETRKGTVRETVPYAIGYIYDVKGVNAIFEKQPSRHSLALLFLDKIIVETKQYIEGLRTHRNKIDIYMRAYNGSRFDFISIVHSWLHSTLVLPVNFVGINPEGVMKYWILKLKKPLKVKGQNHAIKIIFTDPKNFVAQENKDITSVAEYFSKLYPDYFKGHSVTKREYDHKAQQAHYDRYGEVEENFRDYLEQDVLLLRCVCTSLDTLFCRSYRFRSLANYAYRELLKMVGDKDKTKGKNEYKHSYMFHVDKTLNEVLRTTILGGRVQTNVRGVIEEDNEEPHITYIDCNSLYPYVCINNSFPKPQGTIRYDALPNHTPSSENVRKRLQQALRDKKLFVVYAELTYTEKGLRMPVVLPVRNKDDHPETIDTIDWNTRLDEGWILSNMFQLMLDYNILDFSHCIFDSLIVFETGPNPFVDYMMKYKAMKERSAKDSPERALAKDMSNSITGKCVMKLVEREWKFIGRYTNPDNLIRPLEMGQYKIGYFNSNRPDRAPLHLGVFIYSYAREWMYRSCYAKIPRFLYTDTDSLIVQTEDLPLLGDILDDKEYGKFKVEYQIKKLIITDKKEYFFVTIEDKTIIRFKGLEKGYTKRYWMILENGDETERALVTIDDYEILFLSKLNEGISQIWIDIRGYRNDHGLISYESKKYLKRE